MPAPAHSRVVDLSKYQAPGNDYSQLSLRDLLTARDLYHEHLIRYRNVVATAVGKYRIRIADSWPNARHQVHHTTVRTLQNSEVRPYSWPAILVFVSEWQDTKDFARHPAEMVPNVLFMPDGRKVPVCIIEAPKEEVTPINAPDFSIPSNNIGPGYPILASVQGREYAATVGCLVSDGHTTYAMTNRHVTGEGGMVVNSGLSTGEGRVGVSAGHSISKLPFTTVYPSFPGTNTLVNLDIGLIEIDDVNRWTTKVRGIGTVGQMVDYSDSMLSLSLVGCHVCGFGAASGEMKGEIQALFYRYKTSGGFEYVSDLLIGPRSQKSARANDGGFVTLPGDSGTMWMLEPHDATNATSLELLPLAIQWGRDMLNSVGQAPPQGYALATLMSRACALLEVDPIRAWNLDQNDTWGSIGHFSIAAYSRVALASPRGKLATLMKANAEIISRSDDDIMAGDFKGLGSEDFVPLSDVPDFFWKPRVGKQGHTRSLEGPNHFADMDQPGPNGKTLLDLTMDDAFVDPAKWNEFYNSVTDILSGKKISQVHRGLLPFRVWQIFDGMVEFVKKGRMPEFICAAGVLTHYVGDACQPLHISYLHDGDPERPVTYTYQKGKKAGVSEERPLGQGVHSAYEDSMVFDNRQKILTALGRLPGVKNSELITTGFDAAKLTINLMRATFKAIAPMDIVETYVNSGSHGKQASEALWSAYGARTLKVMQAGAHLNAVLWQSAWTLSNGDRTMRRTKPLTQTEAMQVVSDEKFLPSTSIGQIGELLSTG